MDKETADALRGLITLATLRNIKDDGETQTASFEVAEGVWRDGVEVMQPYGLAAHIPQDGAVAIIFAIGGDQGNLKAVPIANPSRRMGNLAEADVGLYNAHGDKMVLKTGGDLDVKTGANVHVKTDKTVTVTANDSVDITATKCTVTGDFECSGDVSDKNGSMQEMRDLYNQHGHPDASPPPNPLQE